MLEDTEEEIEGLRVELQDVEQQKAKLELNIEDLHKKKAEVQSRRLNLGFPFGINFFQGPS